MLHEDKRLPTGLTQAEAIPLASAFPRLVEKSSKKGEER